MSCGDEPGDEGRTERKAARIALRTYVHLRKSGYHKTEVSLLDVSERGCQVELPERVAVGETVWITLPGLQPIESRVAWVREWLAGLEFKQPIYPSVFELLVSRMKNQSRV
ncbi:MAG TPA: PilZ domain-containing protein [Allosphingosinicella sp.]|nr:PilZ domain-containing protein [Allosphingosinicella sp.]